MATMPQITPSGVEALATRQSSHSDQEQKQETEIFVLQVLEVLRCAHCVLQGCAVDQLIDTLLRLFG